MDDVNETKTPTENIPEEDFSELVKDYDLRAIDSHAPVEGRIVDILDDRIILDIGQKTEGILNRQELLDWEGKLSAQVGDVITVLPQNVNYKEGYITVSKKALAAQEGWEKVLLAFKRNLPVTGRIVRLTPDEKGYIVDCGVEMFLPMSQVDLQKVRVPLKMIGKEFQFRVTKLNKKEKGGLVSRRVLLEEEKKEMSEKLLGVLQPGQLVKGVVTSLVDYGAFVDLGGMEGLLHKENISYGRINHPKEKLHKGDEIEVKVLDIDRERGKISLGLKQKFPDPWLSISEKYPLGKRLVAKVVKIVEFGAFIELEEGVEGLLHISDLTWEGRPNSVEEYVAVGEEIWVQVIEVSPEAKKIKLGLKQLETRPEEKYLKSHFVGEVVRGKVKKILKSRVFVGLEEDVEGVIRISDISYFHIETPEEFLREGEEIEAKIISNELDRNYKVQLSLKHMSDNEWSTFFARNKPGNIIPVTLKSVSDKGITAAISKNIEGFIRLGDIDEERIEFADIQKRFKAGDRVDAMIVRTEPERKKVYLSLKSATRQREREEMAKYMKPEDDNRTTIGDLLQNELDRKK